MVWPDRISKNVVTNYPAVTHDFLPTIMEAFGVSSDHPDWPLDGVSLMPFANGQHPTRRDKPIGFWWGDQKAWIDNDLKLVENVTPGQGCVLEPPYTKASDSGVFLYNLTADMAESVDLKTTMAPKFASMTTAFEVWSASVTASAKLNNCGGSGPSPPAPGPPAPIPSNCTFERGAWGYGGDSVDVDALTRQGCCDACRKMPLCTLAVFKEASQVHKGQPSVCHLKADEDPSKRKTDGAGYWACRARNVTAV